jgi:hypothetical protein
MGGSGWTVSNGAVSDSTCKYPSPQAGVPQIYRCRTGNRNSGLGCQKVRTLIKCIDPYLHMGYPLTSFGKCRGQPVAAVKFKVIQNEGVLEPGDWSIDWCILRPSTSTPIT